jgi:DNA-binding MarR family transcriptional regulator
MTARPAGPPSRQFEILTESGNEFKRDRFLLKIGARVKHRSKLDLGDYLPYLANRVGTIIADRFGEEVLAADRLSIPMWRVMAALAGDGGQRQIEASTLSRLVTRLVRLGLVTRKRSASSTREVVVNLTAKGTARVARLIPIAREYEAAALADLPRDDIAVLKRCLRRMYDNMKNRPVRGR